MVAPKERPVQFAGPAGMIEGVLHEPPGDSRLGTAVVCHPHPLHQGTMDNKVVHTLARTLATAGFAALRFNFRGVGGSAGGHDDGRGETDDAVAAMHWVRGELGQAPDWLAGFSFGSAVALRAASRQQVGGLITVAPPVLRLGGAVAPSSTTRWLVIQGEEDDVVLADDVVAWVNDQEPRPELALVPGAGHFFHGKLTQLRDLVTDFIADA